LICKTTFTKYFAFFHRCVMPGVLKNEPPTNFSQRIK